jgi:hypothetical protein
MMLTLTLAAGLLAAPEPQAEPPKGEGWVVELRGYTYHQQAKPEGWIIELNGFHKHSQAKPKELILEFQWPKAKAEGLIIEPLETQYHDDLSAFFEQLQVQVQVQVAPVETMYFDDLPAFFKSLKQKP